jgi:hypothetical protein
VKPDTRTAMRHLVAEVRSVMPFDLPPERLCDGACSGGCALKLLDYLDGELETWIGRVDAGEMPNFGDLARLEKTSRKIYRVLARKGLI